MEIFHLLLCSLYLLSGDSARNFNILDHTGSVLSDRDRHLTRGNKCHITRGDWVSAIHQVKGAFTSRIKGRRPVTKQNGTQVFIPILLITVHVHRDALNQRAIEAFYQAIALGVVRRCEYLVCVHESTDFLEQAGLIIRPAISKQFPRGSVPTNHFIYQ